MAMAAAALAINRAQRLAGLGLAAAGAILVAVNLFHPLTELVYAKGIYRDPASIE